jgi:hypothetical protein
LGSGGGTRGGISGSIPHSPSEHGPLVNCANGAALAARGTRRAIPNLKNSIFVNGSDVIVVTGNQGRTGLKLLGVFEGKVIEGCDLATQNRYLTEYQSS